MTDLLTDIQILRLNSSPIFRAIVARLDEITQQLGDIMATQDQYKADLTALTNVVSQLGTSITAVEAEVATLKATNPDIDITALEAAIAQLTTMNSTLNAGLETSPVTTSPVTTS